MQRIFVLMLVLFAMLSAANGSLTPTAAGAPSRPAATTGLFLNRSNETTSGTVLVDGTGRIHFAYSDWNSVNAAFYGTCAANCNSLSSWAIATINNGTTTVKLAYLGFDAAGHPRMLLFSLGTDYKHGWQYTECNANCTDGANWTTPLTLISKVSLSFAETVQDAAFDPQGRPRFVYYDTDSGDNHFGTFYVYCDSNCTADTNWYELQLFADRLRQPALTFTASGQPRLLIGDWISINTPSGYTYYVTCDSNCTDPGSVQANWLWTRLYEEDAATYWALRLDSQGRPRLALHADQGSSGGDLLYYVWCNTNCSDAPNWATNWSRASVGLTAGDGLEPALALDSQGRPRIAYRKSNGSGLGYGSCDTNCQSNSGNWQNQLFEASSTLDTDWPFPPPSGCLQNGWVAGHRPSLALDSGGNPHIGYYARQIHSTGCTAGEAYRAARFVFAGSGMSGVQIFLPLIKR